MMYTAVKSELSLRFGKISIWRDVTHVTSPKEQNRSAMDQHTWQMVVITNTVLLDENSTQLDATVGLTARQKW